MCYGNPDAILADILQARPLTSNEHGHTALEDSEHFCAYSGCDPGNAWAKLVYISARLPTT
jgi:hypothetical protein